MRGLFPSFFNKGDNMKLKIYNNKSNKNIVNKKIEEIQEISFNFKDYSDITNPILILQTYKTGNYCYIPDLKRYYYIDRIELMKGGFYRLYLEIDVLMSYKDEIINADWYSVSGVNVTIPNEVDYNSLVDYEQFLLTIGG